MNRNLSPTIKLAALGALIVLLAACNIPLGDAPAAVETAQPASPPEPAGTVVLPVDNVILPTIDGARPEPQPAVPTAAPPTPAVVVTAEAPVQAQDPYLVARRAAEVRAGPGLNYALSHTLSAGISTPVQGRSPDGLWWAIPGDSSGPLVWVQAADVDFYGEAAGLPVISPPSTGRTDIPVHADPGSPPGDACVAVPLASSPEPPLVRLGPGEQFNVAYRLGGWAEVLKTEIGWHMLLLGPGETGWVNGDQVQLSGPCP